MLKNVGDSSWFIDYKMEIVKKLITSQKIIELLLDEVGVNISEPEVELVDNLIYTYHVIPDIEVSAKNYIVVNTRISNVDNEKILSIDTTIYIFVPLASMKLDSSFCRVGNRLDNLAKEVIALFNQQKVFGIGKVQMLPNKSYVPAKGYDGYELCFRTSDINK